MRKTIVILVCVLLIAASVPLFAHGYRDHHGHSGKSDLHRWHGSLVNPAFLSWKGWKGWKGWGQAPSEDPEETPAEEPSNPPGKDANEVPEEKPVDGSPTSGDLILNLRLNPFYRLNLFDGSFLG